MSNINDKELPFELKISEDDNVSNPEKNEEQPSLNLMHDIDEVNF